MRINGLSNTQYQSAGAFKGIYTITGTNAEINRAIKHLRHAKQNNTGISFDKFGISPYSDTMFTYLLVTTGEDAKIYNDFVKNAQTEYSRNSEEFPDNLRREDFESEKDFENHQRMSEALNILEVLSKKCNFTKQIHNVTAKRALDAMKNGEFDYKEGRIIKD